jgi:acyl-CoA thioester hydrolase
VTKPEALAEYPVIITLPVQWGEQDAFGHVNNTVPLRWFESARIAYIEQAGLAGMMEDDDCGPIVASITCNYRRQIKYPDTLHVGARIGRIGRSSFAMEHAVYSTASGAIAVDGETVVVVFNYASQRPVRVPDTIRAAMARLEGRALE